MFSCRPGGATLCWHDAKCARLVAVLTDGLLCWIQEAKCIKIYKKGMAAKMNLLFDSR